MHKPFLARSNILSFVLSLVSSRSNCEKVSMILRSKRPDLVRQEFYGFIMAHFAIRGLMHEAALQADKDPDELSFLHTVRVVRRKLPRFATIPPSAEAYIS